MFSAYAQSITAFAKDLERSKEQDVTNTEQQETFETGEVIYF